MGGVVDTVRDRVRGGPGGSGYSSVYSGGSREEESSALYRGQEDDDDLFGEYHGSGDGRSETISALGGSKATTHPGKSSGGGGWDEDWKDF